MPTIRGQARVLSSELPIGLRQTALQVTNAIPDVQLPNFLPSISRGNSFTLNLPSITGRGGGTRLSIPTPVDALKVAEGVLPTNVPRLSTALGFSTRAADRNGEEAMSGRTDAADRPQTRLREFPITSGSTNGDVLGGGYRSI
jgi:hypothetical protein